MKSYRTSIVKIIINGLLNSKISKTLAIAAFTLNIFQSKIKADIISSDRVGTLCPGSYVLSFPMYEKAFKTNIFKYATGAGSCIMQIDTPPIGVHGITFNYYSDLSGPIGIRASIYCLGGGATSKSKAIITEISDGILDIPVYTDLAGLTCPQNRPLYLKIDATAYQPAYPYKPGRNIEISNLNFY